MCFFSLTVADIFAQKCCQIDCYTLPDCKLAQSDECTTAPVECAMGMYPGGRGDGETGLVWGGGGGG